MREIKFRAWIDNKQNRYMAIQGEPDLETFGSFIHHYSDCEKLMQFTGLKDKNGKEIYEGDILENPENKKSVIIWTLNGYFAESQKDDRITSFPLSLYFVENKKIIGNIYENPELLNK